MIEVKRVTDESDRLNCLEPVDESDEDALWELFVAESNKFRAHVSPGTSFRLRKKPSRIGNWFCVAFPQNWGRANGRDGFHWLMGVRQYNGRPTRAVYLGVGIESPIKNNVGPPDKKHSHRDEFVHRLLNHPELKVPESFKLSDGERYKKLLVSPNISLDSFTGKRAIELYDSCSQFNSLMQKLIKSYWSEFGLEAFSKELKFS